METELKIGVTLIIAIILLSLTFAYKGETVNQEKIEDRALKLERKECYSWQDIEYVMFGEIQE